MDNWQNEWFKLLETTAIEVEQFFGDIAKDLEDATDALIQFSAEITDQFYEAIAPSLNQFDEQMEEWMEPIVQALVGFDTTLSETAAPLTRTVEPILNEHPVCVGCRNYHGQVYGNTMLVCALHPYGVPEGEATCPDKEPYSWKFPSTSFHHPFDRQD